jgi:lycopene cyclase domain-containing protein
MLNKEYIIHWFPLIGLGLLVSAFMFTVVPHAYQDYAVPHWKQLVHFETSYLYLYTLVGSICFPFLLSFDRKVHFYTRWKTLMMATLPVALIFIMWDAVFTSQGAWGFNDTYLMGARFMGLPVEELLWFFIIPYCCVFIYECLEAYFAPAFNTKWMKMLSLTLSVVFILVALVFSDKIYTTVTFTAAAMSAFWLYRFADVRFSSSFYLTWLISLIPFLLVNGILTGLFTMEPVVVYSPDAFMGIRIVSIPLEDAFYLWAYLFVILWVYEILKKNTRKGNSPGVASVNTLAH